MEEYECVKITNQIYIGCQQVKWSERHLKFKIPEDSKQQLQKNQLCVVGEDEQERLSESHSFQPL